MATPIPDPRFVPCFTLETLFVSKDSGLPLSGGIVKFYVDNGALTPKEVFQLSGTEPTYTFTSLGAELTLSSVGDFLDTLSNPTVPYFYPYDSDGNEELYYVVVESSGGVSQFTRHAVPYTGNSGGAGGETLGSSTNMVSNPQFAEINFYPGADGTESHVYSVSAATTNTIDVAPGWQIITTGTGSVTVTRQPIIDVSAASNPNYALKIATSGITGTYQLVQRLEHTPRLYANNIISSYFLASLESAGTPQVNFVYKPSGVALTYLQANVPLESAAGFKPYKSTVAIEPPINPDSAETGYIDIYMDVPVNNIISFSSFQIAQTPELTTVLDFEQESVARQIDHLFHYWKPRLEYKPIPSYLVGWDFPLNPCQFKGAYIPVSKFAIGANKSQYIWDQTIAYQSVDSSLQVGRLSGNGSIQVVCMVPTQMALIQYLPEIQARELLLGNMSVNVLGYATVGPVVNITVTLVYTEDATLPDVSAGVNNSVVTTLDANGGLATSPATWVTVGNPQGSTQALTTTLSSQAFSGFASGPPVGTGSNTATFFAIIVGSSALRVGQSVNFQSISLVKGDIPTIPAPKTLSETLADCQYYYQKSFPWGVVPVGGTGAGGGVSIGPQTAGALAHGALGPIVRYNTEMRALPLTTLFNPDPGGSGGNIYNATRSLSMSTSAAGTTGVGGFVATGSTVTGSSVGDELLVNWTSDARLGIV